MPLFQFLYNNFLGMLNTVFTNMAFLAGDKYFYFIPAATTKGTMEICLFCHKRSTFFAFQRIIAYKNKKTTADSGSKVKNFNASNLQFIYNLIDNAISNSFTCIHPIITIEIFHNLLNRFTTILGKNFCTYFFCFANLISLNLDIRRSSLEVASETWL